MLLPSFPGRAAARAGVAGPKVPAEQRSPPQLPAMLLLLWLSMPPMMLGAAFSAPPKARVSLNLATSPSVTRWTACWQQPWEPEQIPDDTHQHDNNF
jgi:hypothetical protein